MKYFLLVILLTSHCVCAQNFNPKNPGTLIGELGKNGLVFNLLYDHYFSEEHFGFHAGGGTSIFNHYFELRTATIGFYFLIGRKKEFYDLGFEVQYHFADRHSDDQKGFILIDPPISYEGVYPFITVGYRRYSDRGVFRIGLAAGFIEKEFIAGPYVGYGIILNRKRTK